LMPEPEYCRDRCPADPKRCRYEGSRAMEVSRIEAALREHSTWG